MRDRNDRERNTEARVLESLRARLEGDAAMVAPLVELCEREFEAAALMADLEGQIRRLNDAAIVCLVGPTGAGKSTLLNALAGKAVAVEGADRPTTETPVVYAPSDLDPSALEPLLPADVVRYDPVAELPWSGHVLVDAPDTNSVRVSHRETVERLAAASDVLLLVLHHQGVVEGVTAQFVDDYFDRRRLAVVLNRTDEMTEAVREQLVGQVGELVTERWGEEAPVFALSATGARRSPGSERGFSDLVAWLAHLVEQRIVGGLRRDNMTGTLSRLERLYAEVAEQTEPRLQRLTERVEEGWDALGKSVLGDVERRTTARRADIETLLAAEIARRWRGPGGYLLRLGAWGPAAAVGTLAIRRNPLVAGALAATGHAADRVRAVRAESRVASGSEISPTPTDLAVWATDAFRGARMELHGLAVDGEAPTWTRLGDIGEEGVPALVQAIDDRWEATVARDLPEAADGWGLRWLRFPLDVPFYALGAHVGWRTVASYVEGFVSGVYQGMDFYVNALGVLAVTGALTYGVARAGVAVAARGFLRRARGGLAGAAEQVIAERRGRAYGDIEACRNALARLADRPRT